MAVMSGELLRDHPYKTHTLKCRHTLATYVWEMRYKRSALNVAVRTRFILDSNMELMCPIYVHLLS